MLPAVLWFLWHDITPVSNSTDNRYMINRVYTLTLGWSFQVLNPNSIPTDKQASSSWVHIEHPLPATQ